jgi:hypothetical protein
VKDYAISSELRSRRYEIFGHQIEGLSDLVVSRKCSRKETF